MIEMGMFLVRHSTEAVVIFCAIGAFAFLAALYNVVGGWDFSGAHRPQSFGRHRYEGTPDEATRNLMPITTAARTRVAMIRKEGFNGYHAGPGEGLREAEENYGEEEGSTHRKRWEDCDWS
jgi:hypothetical protein